MSVKKKSDRHEGIFQVFDNPMKLRQTMFFRHVCRDEETKHLVKAKHNLIITNGIGTRTVVRGDYFMNSEPHT